MNQDCLEDRMVTIMESSLIQLMLVSLLASTLTESQNLKDAILKALRCVDHEMSKCMKDT